MRRVCGAAVLALIASVTMARASEPPCHGIVVEDGDTVRVGEEVVRLRGFDAPEVEHARCEAERRLGLMAKARIEALICAASAAEIDRGPAPERDRHKRSLARLMLDGRDVAEVMIAEQWARPYNGSIRKGWCSRDSRDDLIPGPQPKRR